MKHPLYHKVQREFERAYWKALAAHKDATSYREAAKLAGVTASTVVRKFAQYGLRLKYGRR
jgi:DNA-binding NtrC family response regulator